MDEIKLDDLLKLCSYGTSLVVKRADNGKTVIDNVNALANSKDKRQKVKWDVFKKTNVYGIRPSLRTEGIKRGDDWFRMTIVVWIPSGECERAVAEYKRRLDSEQDV